MNRYKYVYLIWLLPAIFLFLTIQQAVVHYSLINTYNNGKTYVAHVLHIDVKKIGTQTTGSITLRFKGAQAKEITKEMSLPYEMASQLGEGNVLAIRYRKNALEDIVMIPAYRVQKDLIWTNFLIGLLGFLITLVLAIFAHRYARKKIKIPDEPLVIKRV